MSLPLDHVVIAVHDLVQAMNNYRQLGFQVLTGGKHPGRESSNAVIVFADRTYIELIAWAAPNEERWYITLKAEGEGMVDFALLPHDTMRVLAEAQARGLESLQGPVDGGRVRPDGQILKWRSARSTTGDMPFLCGDLTPRSWRVPDAPELCQHANGATGIGELKVKVRDVAASTARYRALLGDEAVTLDSGHPRNASVQLNGTVIWLIQGGVGQGADIAASSLPDREGPYWLGLRNENPNPPGLDRSLTCGANLSWI